MIKQLILRLSTRSAKSFRDETVKYFSRVSCKSGQSIIICLTESRSPQDSQFHKLVGHCLTDTNESRQNGHNITNDQRDFESLNDHRKAFSILFCNANDVILLEKHGQGAHLCLKGH